MEFLVIGMDGKDEKALERRLAVREAHLALGEKMRAAGHMICAASVLDDNEKMVGSVIICDFQSRHELEQWLKEEPYVVGKVWQTVEVKSCRLGPSFSGLKIKSPTEAN